MEKTPWEIQRVNPEDPPSDAIQAKKVRTPLYIYTWNKMWKSQDHQPEHTPSTGSALVHTCTALPGFPCRVFAGQANQNPDHPERSLLPAIARAKPSHLGTYPTPATNPTSGKVKAAVRIQFRRASTCKILLITAHAQWNPVVKRRARKNLLSIKLDPRFPS